MGSAEQCTFVAHARVQPVRSQFRFAPKAKPLAGFGRSEAEGKGAEHSWTPTALCRVALEGAPFLARSVREKWGFQLQLFRNSAPKNQTPDRSQGFKE